MEEEEWGSKMELANLIFGRYEESLEGNRRRKRKIEEVKESPGYGMRLMFQRL